MSPRIVAFCAEPPWPPHHGGRVRMAGILSALAARNDVHVLCPRACSGAPDGIESHVVTSDPRNRWEGLLGPRPKVATVLLGSSGPYRDLVAELDPDLLWFSHSYVAAWFGRTDIPTVVDFQNLERERLRSMMRARFHPARLVEVVKAAAWEPQVARRSGLACAIRPSDQSVLRAWGARSVVGLPNGSCALPSGPSPAAGPVTFVGSMDYEPNYQAACWLVDRVWPQVVRAQPSARLRLVGRAAASLRRRVPEGVEIAADVEDVAPYYREASLVLAPTHSGGGVQLKVSEALAHGRVVVATPFAAAPFGDGAHIPGLVTAGGEAAMAEAIGTLLADVGRRHGLEREALAAGGVPSWDVACEGLLSAIRQLTRVGLRDARRD